MTMRHWLATVCAVSAIATGGMLLGTGVAAAQPPPGTTGSALQGARFLQSILDLTPAGDGPHEWMLSNVFATGSGGEYCRPAYYGFGVTSVCW